MKRSIEILTIFTCGIIGLAAFSAATSAIGEVTGVNAWLDETVDGFVEKDNIHGAGAVITAAAGVHAGYYTGLYLGILATSRFK